MSELQSGTRTRERIVKRPADDRSSLVCYHGPYVDPSGERFYLPKKWHRGGKDNNEWHECNFDYAFKKDEMNSTDLMRNLCWLGQSNKIMKFANNSDGNSDHDVVDLVEEDDNSEGELIGCGVQPSPKKRKKIRVDDNRMPEMDNTLSNWTLHGQNLGKMLGNYKRQYRDLPPNH